jgi:hypothetical protein
MNIIIFNKKLFQMLNILVLVGTGLLFLNCEKNPAESQPKETFELVHLTEPSHYPGIAIYTADMAKNQSTEVNSEWVIRKSGSVKTTSEILRKGYNAIQKITIERFINATDYMEFVVAIQGKLVNKVPVSEDFLKNLTGISFRAVSFNTPIKITLEARNINGVVIKSQNFELNTDQMRSYTMAITDKSLHHIALKIEGKNQDLSSFRLAALGLDDIYLNNNNPLAFVPPADDTAFLKWLKESSLRYFLWQYRAVDGNRGIVLESYDNDNIVSLSGMGYAYAAFVLAAQEGLISEDTAKQRITSMLKWQQAQNWFNGSEGKYGFPLHYYNVNGTGKYPSDVAAVSTIDWAMCAAGIRVVRQKYSSDSEIMGICNELLNRPQWKEVVANNPSNSYQYGRIVKGLKATTGEKDGGVWGDAFSEETELIYLEALASGKVNDLDLTRIFREKKSGFYVSWFGAGFTYNWLQLWTGTQEPYKSNSIAAFQNDASTANAKFGRPLMGLTACSTIGSIESDGFINWNRYISNQGASVSGASSGEVIQISPAPYGAALAMPFQSSTAIKALREYVKLGYYHPLLGLPDNVRMNDFSQNVKVPVPNWDTFDINIGAIAMSIEQTQQNSISNYYTKDNAIAVSLQKLINSFK